MILNDKFLNVVTYSYVDPSRLHGHETFLWDRERCT